MFLCGFVPLLILLCTEIVWKMKGVRIVGTIVRIKEGTWRALIRRKGKYASHTFRLKSLAQE